MKRSRILMLIVGLVILSLTLMGCGLVTASVRLMTDPTATPRPRQTLPLATRTPRVEAQAPTRAPSTQAEQAPATGGAIPGQGQGEAQPGQAQQNVQVPAADQSDSRVFTAVYQKVSPSVVRIDNLTAISENNADEALP
jgi:hypothetical protein